MSDVKAHVREIIAAITAAEPPTSPAFAAAETDAKPVGACPRCGGAVTEGRPVYKCAGCDFVIFKTMSGRAISRRLVTTLLRDRRTDPIKGFRSKRTGKEFSAGLEIREDGSVGLWFAEEAAVGSCPRCGAPVRSRGKVWGCSGDDCGVHVFREMSGRKLDDVIGVLLEQGRTPVIEGFTSRTKGTSFSAAIRLDESGKAVFDFDGDAPKAAPTAGPVPVAAPPAEGDAPADPSGMACPACGEGRLLRGRTAWGCSRWKEGCRWTLRYDAVRDGAEAVQRVRSAAR
jgi:DNA topoisomerase-3